MSDVAPVEVKNEEPIPVTVARQPDTAPETQARTVAAKAGVDADVLTTEGQRRINLIWERTQAIIAISVTLTTLCVAAVLTIAPVFLGSAINAALATAAVTGMVLLSNLVGVVTGFYFSRTNHSKTGGVGRDDLGR